MIEHLEQIDKLITSAAAPAEVRGHIHAIREQIEAYEQEAQKVAEYKKQIDVLKAENAKLQQKPKLQAAWGSQPRIPGRMG
jgi:hypothetical protein